VCLRWLTSHDRRPFVPPGPKGRPHPSAGDAPTQTPRDFALAAGHRGIAIKLVAGTQLIGRQVPAPLSIAVASSGASMTPRNLAAILKMFQIIGFGGPFLGHIATGHTGS
jgi:hypothetical protein